MNIVKGGVLHSEYNNLDGYGKLVDYVPRVIRSES